MYYIIEGNTVLAHHGILGMKWGIRRYQNKDGTLTPEGRKRLKLDNVYSDNDYVAKKGTKVNRVRHIVRSGMDDYNEMNEKQKKKKQREKVMKLKPVWIPNT